MTKPVFEPLRSFIEYPPEEMAQRAASYHSEMKRRRTVREYADRPVPRGVIEVCLRAAATAPSGANIQPWYFVVVEDGELKRQIRLAAEEEEQNFYRWRAPKEWLEAVAPLGTDERKPFLETAGALIAVFAEQWSYRGDGQKLKHYYVPESVGIACGLLIGALHHAGLATLTHTPSPMGFLNDILGNRATISVPLARGRLSGEGREGADHHKKAVRPVRRLALARSAGSPYRCSPLALAWATGGPVSTPTHGPISPSPMSGYG